MEDPVEIDEASNEASVNPGDKPFDAEYVLGDSNEVRDDSEAQNEVQNESNSDSEDDLEDEDSEGENSEATE